MLDRAAQANCHDVSANAIVKPDELETLIVDATSSEAEHAQAVERQDREPFGRRAVRDGVRARVTGQVHWCRGGCGRGDCGRASE